MDIRIEVYNPARCGFDVKLHDKDFRILVKETEKRINQTAKCWIDGKHVRPNPRFHSRLTWFTPDLVVKLDDYDDDGGDGQSTIEWENWRRVRRSRHRDFVVPIVAHGNSEDEYGTFWIAQPRYRFVLKSKVTQDMVWEAADMLAPVVNYLGLEDVGLRYYGENWGITEAGRRPIIWDYGV